MYICIDVYIYRYIDVNICIDIDSRCAAPQARGCLLSSKVTKALS